MKKPRAKKKHAIAGEPAKLPCGCVVRGCGHVASPAPAPSLAGTFGEFFGGLIRMLATERTVKPPPREIEKLETVHSFALLNYAGERPEEFALELARQRRMYRELYDERGHETPLHAELCRTSPAHARLRESVRAHRRGYRVGYESAFETYLPKLKPDPNAN